MSPPSNPRADRLASNQPLAVAERCWMIGHRNPSSLLQCNTYLRRFPGPRYGTSVCIDPGSQLDAAVIEANLESLSGEAGLDFIAVNHQDPDVTGNLPALCQRNPAATVIVSADTWRLVQHLLVRPGNLQFPPALGSRLQRLSSGVTWQPVPTPFCHFRGAMAFYDPEARVFFSGDLFGGFNLLGRVHLFAEEPDWAGIALFHQIYMPSREVLRYAVRQIRALTPKIELIAPQHGHVIAGDLVPLFLDRMEQLPVGYDLLVTELEDQFSSEYRELVVLLLNDAREILGPDELAARMQAETVNDGVEELLIRSGDEWTVKQNAYSCVSKVFDRITQGEEHSFATELRNRVLRFCSERGAPVPLIGWGLEWGATDDAGNSAE